MLYQRFCRCVICTYVNIYLCRKTWRYIVIGEKLYVILSFVILRKICLEDLRCEGDFLKKYFLPMRSFVFYVVVVGEVYRLFCQFLWKGEDSMYGNNEIMQRQCCTQGFFYFLFFWGKGVCAQVLTTYVWMDEYRFRCLSVQLCIYIYKDI